MGRSQHKDINNSFWLQRRFALSPVLGGVTWPPSHPPQRPAKKKKRLPTPALLWRLGRGGGVDCVPSYLVVGGLVFMPLTLPWLLARFSEAVLPGAFLERTTLDMHNVLRV